MVLFSDFYAGMVDVDNIEIIDLSSSVQIGKLLSNAALAAQLTVIMRKSLLQLWDVRTMSAHSRLNQAFTDSRPGYLAYLCDYICWYDKWK